MANPLYDALGNGGQMNGFMRMMQQFQQFRNSFKGDPKKTVQDMIASGRITQDQLNAAQNAAQQFMKMMPK